MSALAGYEKYKNLLEEGFKYFQHRDPFHVPIINYTDKYWMDLTGIQRVWHGETAKGLLDRPNGKQMRVYLEEDWYDKTHTEDGIVYFLCGLEDGEGCAVIAFDPAKKLDGTKLEETVKAEEELLSLKRKQADIQRKQAEIDRLKKGMEDN